MDPPLRERLRWRNATRNGVETPATRATMARTGALFWAAGACFALISVLLPDTAVKDEPLLVAVAIAAALAAAVLLIVYDRIPPWGFQLAVVCGTATASVAAYAWGSESSYGPLPYLWVTLFAFYFFSLEVALVHTALVAAGYAIALVVESPPGNHLDGWIATVGTLLVGGMFVLLVRDRMVSLVESLSEA